MVKDEFWFFLFHFSTFIDLNEPFHSVKNLESSISKKKFWRGKPCTVLLIRPRQKKIGERIDGRIKFWLEKKTYWCNCWWMFWGYYFCRVCFFYFRLLWNSSRYNHLLKLINIQSFTLDYCEKIAKILVFSS